MKKTLLIAAAALAAGVVSTQAQVYSQNIVGYVSKQLPLGYSCVSIPLNGSNDNNSLTNTIVNTGQLDGANLYIYNGVKFTVYTFDSTMETGFGDAQDAVAVPAPVIAPGVAFYINNNTGAALTNVFVGSISVTALSAGVTNTLPAGYTFCASVLPVGGGLTSALQLTNNGALDGTQVFIPNIVGGAVHGYTTVTFDSGMATGFGDAADNAAVAEPQIPVGSGFIFNNNAGLGSVSWGQKLSL